MKRNICFLSIFSLAALFLISGETTRGFTIIYSSSLNGNLDGCTCKSNPRAGLVKRGFFLNRLKDRENSILLDTGDILDPEPDTLLAGHIFESYDELGYHAIALGEQELSNGIDTLLEYRSQFPLVAHNLYVCSTKKSCFIFSLAPKVMKRNTVTVGIVSLFDPGLLCLLEKSVQKKLKVKDPVIIARNMVTLLKEDKVDIILLLFHGYYKTAVNLAREVDGIDLIILGHEQQLINMTRIEDTILISPGKEGNNVGLLTITQKPGGGFFYSNMFKEFDYSIDPDDPSIRKRIAAYNAAE